jgi:hypothetical protein
MESSRRLRPVLLAAPASSINRRNIISVCSPRGATASRRSVDFSESVYIAAAHHLLEIPPTGEASETGSGLRPVGDAVSLAQDFSPGNELGERLSAVGTTETLRLEANPALLKVVFTQSRQLVDVSSPAYIAVLTAVSKSSTGRLGRSLARVVPAAMPHSKLLPSFYFDL